MKRIGLAMLLFASSCWAQESGDFKPAATNVPDASYPRVNSTSQAQFRVKAPDATKMKLNFWSGPKLDMVKDADGFWTVTTPTLAPGLHYYTLIIDGAEVSDPNSYSFFGGGKDASMIEIPEAGATYYSVQNVPHGQVREIWYHSNVTGGWRHALVYLRRIMICRPACVTRCFTCSMAPGKTKPDGSGRGMRTLSWTT